MIKKKFGVGHPHEFDADLPFSSTKEMKFLRAEWKKKNAPHLKKQSPCWEFYLQYIPNKTIEELLPNKDRGLNFLIQKYGEEEGTRRYYSRIEKDKTKNTLNGYIERYGVDGEKKYLEKNKRLSVSVKSLNLNGYTETQIKKIRDNHANNSKNTLETFVCRYGNEIGTTKYEEYKKNHKSMFCLSYWVDAGYNLDESKKIISNLQTRNIDYYVGKYGTEDGIKKYGEITKKKVSRKGRNISNIEEDVYIEILKKYPQAKHNFPIHKYVVDVYIPEKNIIVELYGDYWHCNPKFWKDTMYNKSLKMLAVEKWEKDMNRKINLEELGYKVITIWESDVIKNKEIIHENIK